MAIKTRGRFREQLYLVYLLNLHSDYPTKNKLHWAGVRESLAGVYATSIDIQGICIIDTPNSQYVRDDSREGTKDLYIYAHIYARPRFPPPPQHHPPPPSNQPQDMAPSPNTVSRRHPTRRGSRGQPQFTNDHPDMIMRGQNLVADPISLPALTTPGRHCCLHAGAQTARPGIDRYGAHFELGYKLGCAYLSIYG